MAVTLVSNQSTIHYSRRNSRAIDTVGRA